MTISSTQRLQLSFDHWSKTASLQDSHVARSLVHLMTSPQDITQENRKLAFEACIMMTLNTAATIDPIGNREEFYVTFVPLLALYNLKEAAELVNRLTLHLFKIMGGCELTRFGLSYDFREFEQLLSKKKFADYDAARALQHILQYNPSYLPRALTLCNPYVLTKSLFRNQNLTLEQLDQFKQVANKLENGYEKNDFLAEIAIAEARLNPDLAYQTSESITESSLRSATQIKIAKYAPLPEKARQEVIDARIDLWSLAEVDTTISMSDLQKCMESQEDPEVREDLKCTMIEIALLRNQKEEALKIFETMVSLEHRATAALEMAKIDPSYLNLAWTCVNQLPDHDLNNKMRKLAEFVEIEAQYEPLNALDTAEQLEDKDLSHQSFVFLKIVERIATTNFSLALAITLRIKDPYFQATAFMTLAQALKP